MAKSREPLPPLTNPVRCLFVEPEDAEAARRLLALLETGVAAAPDPSPAGEGRGGREPLLQQALLAHGVRQRRMRILGDGISAELPFAMLLALYVAEDREPAVTITRLTQLAWVHNTTALRWIDVLVAGGWLQREDDRQDRRKTLLSLTQKARSALDELFRWAEQPPSVLRLELEL